MVAVGFVILPASNSMLSSTGFRSSVDSVRFGDIEVMPDDTAIGKLPTCKVAEVAIEEVSEAKIPKLGVKVLGVVAMALVVIFVLKLNSDSASVSPIIGFSVVVLGALNGSIALFVVCFVLLPTFGKLLSVDSWLKTAEEVTLKSVGLVDARELLLDCLVGYSLVRVKFTVVVRVLDSKLKGAAVTPLSVSFTEAADVDDDDDTGFVASTIPAGVIAETSRMVVVITGIGDVSVVVVNTVNVVSVACEGNLATGLVAAVAVVVVLVSVIAEGAVATSVAVVVVASGVGAAAVSAVAVTSACAIVVVAAVVPVVVDAVLGVVVSEVLVVVVAVVADNVVSAVAEVGLSALGLDLSGELEVSSSTAVMAGVENEDLLVDS